VGVQVQAVQGHNQELVLHDLEHSNKEVEDRNLHDNRLCFIYKEIYMQKRVIFNPFAELTAVLTVTPAVPVAQESTSATVDGQPVTIDTGVYVAEGSMVNNDIGVCPKCKKPMTRASVASGDQVFYCAADRVAMPLPNEISTC
jgi:hypothetical protein